MQNVALALPDELAKQLPVDAVSRQRVVELGLREWRVSQALEAYQRGEGTLAFAAERACVSLREMIAAARARGMSPRADSSPHSLDSAAQL